jgi:hypothetical protein
MVSEGQNDYGGINSLKALRDTILFAAGEKKNLGGFSLGDLSEIVPDFNNVGLYAFSHPGIVATNVMAVYGKQLSAVDYFVGRENPTMDIISALEIGYFSEDEEKKEIKNSAYIFPDSYLSTGLAVDYSSVRWSKTLNAPYFDFNNNSQPDGSDFLLTRPAPLLFNKRAYSDELLLAVQQNGLAAADWPEDLATPEEAARWWGDNRETVNSYSRLKNLNFKVMLVFGAVDHVQTEPDKPHIHQAYDGFNQTAGLWIRLNPDQSYVVLLNKNLATDYQDRAANTEPTDWLKVGQGAYSSKIGNTLVPLAAVMEMADRTHVNNWQTNLTSILAK